MENNRVRFLQDTRKITLLALIPVALVYILKLVIALMWNDPRGMSGIVWVCCIFPLIGAIALGLIILLLWVTAIFIRRHRYGIPTLILWGGMIGALLVPLPPLPPPVFPEEAFFAAHRPDFEQVVTLARDDQLKCGWNGCSFGSELPSEYAYLSLGKNVGVDHDAYTGLTVTFWPLSGYYPLIYFEALDGHSVPMRSICPVDSLWTRKLDDHWYVCAVDRD